MPQKQKKREFCGRYLHLWSFDTEALKEIAKRFENKSVFNVEIKENTITLRLIK